MLLNTSPEDTKIICWFSVLLQAYCFSWGSKGKNVTILCGFQRNYSSSKTSSEGSGTGNWLST